MNHFPGGGMFFRIGVPGVPRPQRVERCAG